MLHSASKQMIFNQNFKIIVFWGEIPCGLIDT